MPSARSQRHMVYLVSVPWRKHTRENEKMRMWLVCYCYMSCKSFHQRVVLHYPEEIYSFANFIVMKWIFYSGINEIGGCESLCLTLALSSSSFRCSRLWEFCFVLTVALDDGILNNNWSNQKMTWHIQEHVNTRLRTQKVWRERTRKRESEGGDKTRQETTYLYHLVLAAVKRMPDNVVVLRNRMETHKHQVSLLNALEAVLMADLYSLVDKST